MLAAKLPAAPNVGRGDRLRRELAVCLSDVEIAVQRGDTEKLDELSALLSAAQGVLDNLTPPVEGE